MSGHYTSVQLQRMAVTLREDVIRMLLNAGSGHSAGSLGLADVYTALYFDILKHDPSKPDWDERDILVTSNGHTAPIRYASMARAGYFEVDELLTLRKFGSRLQGHPERTKLPGLETTSGPLGCGLSQAAGMAYSILKFLRQSDRWVYVVLGDGELNEGNNWEAAMFAAKYSMHNLIAIVDRNNIQIDGSTDEVMPLEGLKEKWESFGWHVLEIDGNNIDSVIDACSMARAVTSQPSIIIAHTIPGKGVDFMEYDYHWHGVAPNSEQAKNALTKLRTLAGQIKADHE